MVRLVVSSWLCDVLLPLHDCICHSTSREWVVNSEFVDESLQVIFGGNRDFILDNAIRVRIVDVVPLSLLLINVGVDLHAFQEADAPPGVDGTLIVLETESKLILEVVLPSYDRVSLPREFLEPSDEASMKNDTLGILILTRLLAFFRLFWRLLLVFTHYWIFYSNACYFVFQRLSRTVFILDTVLRDDLDVVFNIVFGEKYSEPSCADVNPSVLLIQPVELGPILLWREEDMLVV